MTGSKLRRQIAWEAARLLHERQESEYYTAKMKAARRIQKGWVKPADLPSNVEIRDQLKGLVYQFEGERSETMLREMRLEAIRYLRILERYRPRLIGSVLTGHVRAGSDIDIHVFADSIQAVALTLEDEGIVFDVEHKSVRKHGETRTFHHFHIQDQFPVELTIYPANKSGHVAKSSITGKPMERASLAELESIVRDAYPDLDLDQVVADCESRVDRFQVYESLLLPLEYVQQNRKYHPEGDVLYHSLQVFQLAQDELPYDEEFLLAALLHDVGKGIDPHDHVQASLEALAPFITERTAWLIDNHMLAQEARSGTLGVRAHRRLRENESYDELILLATCDSEGRQVGVTVPELEEAIEYVRDLAQTYG